MRLLLALAFVAVAVPTAFAQAPPVRATRTTQPISMDGVLDDAAWKSADVIDGFQQEDPDQGSPTREKTEVRLLFDDEGLYVGARLFDSQPDSIVARLSRRDGNPSSDAFFIFLDPFHDKRTGYYFGMTAAGTQMDGVFMNDGWDDDSWDGVWHGQVSRDALGWSIEMKIPFSQVRFREGNPMVWGVNFKRFLTRSNEEDLLVYTPRGQSGFVSRFPELHGLDGLKPRHSVEVVPYVTSKADYFRGTSEYGGAVGGDLRTSLGSNLSVNGTVNPDFGQVEIDPAVVNLSDVETYFSEKRPFFTEGLSVFRCGNNGANDYWGFNWPEPTFFYTRRIGRSPQAGFLASRDVPVGVSILGAAKITGQPVPGWNFGMLHAVTGRETGTFVDSSGAHDIAVEPPTYYGVLRGMHEFAKGARGLGLMTTAAVRSFDEARNLEPYVNRTALVTTMDGWTFLDPKREWVVSGWAAASNVTGSTARIRSLQRSPVHYYQRPDAGHVQLDSAATSLSGTGARLWLNHQNGRLLLNSAVGYLAPGFDSNDLGYMSRSDVINAHFGTGWQWQQPKGWRQYANVVFALAGSWNTGGVNTLRMMYSAFNLEQRNQMSWNGSLFVMPETMTDRATRGGPLMRNPRSISGNLHFDSDSKAKRFWYVDVGPSQGADGSWGLSVGPGFVWKPMSNLSTEVNPSWERSHTDAQYVRETRDAAMTATYGSRYVFAQLDQTTTSASLRLDYSVTAQVSFQLYVQPYLTSADYSDEKHLARAGTRDFAHGGDAAKSDFSYGSVRGNAVLRWEYRPGSTMFLVWTQQREDELADGRFDLNRSLSTLSRTPGANTVMLKLAHHFSL